MIVFTDICTRTDRIKEEKRDASNRNEKLGQDPDTSLLTVTANSLALQSLCTIYLYIYDLYLWIYSQRCS